MEERGFDYLTLHGGNLQDDKGVMQELGQNLDRLAGLEYLSFSNTCFLTLAASLKFLPNLRYLNLYGCKLGDSGMQALAPCLKGITYLIGLDLSSNNLGLVGAQALAAHFQDLRNLRILKLDLNYNIGLAGIQALAPQLRHLRKLCGLGLHNTLVQAGASGARALAPYLSDLPQLGVLTLQSNNLGDEGVKELIPSFQKLPRLDHLDLTGNQLSRVSAQLLTPYLNEVDILSSTPKNVALSDYSFYLYLGKNQLGDTGAQCFLNLSSNLKPCYIYLEYNNISDETANKLQQIRNVKWNFNKYFGGTLNPSAYSSFGLEIDDYQTSSKESIIESNPEW